MTRYLQEIQVDLLDWESLVDLLVQLAQWAPNIQYLQWIR